MKKKKKPASLPLSTDGNSSPPEVTEAAPAGSKKRKSRSQDPKFSLRAEKRKQGGKRPYGNPLHMRTDHSKAKVSILVGENVIPADFSPKTVRTKLQDELKSVASYRPMVNIEGTLNKNNQWTPKVGYTPEGKTRMVRAGTLGGGLRFFQEKTLRTKKKSQGLFAEFTAPPSPSIPPPPLPVRELTKDSPFYQSDSYKAIKRITDTYKMQAVTIDDILRSKVSAERKDKNSLSRSQHLQMVQPGINPSLGSATQYAQATELFTEKINVRWEWLHLVAHMIMGDASQNANNLVCGEEALNTWMLLAEKEISYLQTIYSTNFTLEVRAQLIPGTHIATNIDYVIQTEDFKLPLGFVADELTEAPHYDFSLMLHAYVKTLVNLSKEKRLAQAEDETPALKRPRL